MKVEEMQTLGSLSDSVERMRKTFGDDPVTVASVINYLLETHPQYGGGLAEKYRLDGKRDQVERPLVEWLQEVRALYEDDEMLLHGRLVILGLALIYPRTYVELNSDGFLDVLMREITPSYTGLLSPDGKARLDRLLAFRERESEAGKEAPAESQTDAGADEPPDEPVSPAAEMAGGTPPAPGFQSGRTRLQMDNRAVVDQLGRHSYVTALGLQIRYLRHMKIDNPQNEDDETDSKLDRDQALLLHLYGPWGSGKSSILYFLQKHLEKPLPPEDYERTNCEPWIVVNFNAWQHQRSDPPWWDLMDTVYSQARARLWELGRRGQAFNLRIREQYWRISTPLAPRLLSMFVVLIFLAAIIFGAYLFGRSRIPGADIVAQYSTDWIERVPVLLSFLVILFGAALVVTRILFPGTSQSAQAFVEMSRDPMTRLSNHFTTMIERWIRAPVIVLIDDLDRCDEAYVIKLLENIQTLFRRAPVFYVVAADKQWLTTSFENAFESYAHPVGRPGVPLGYLFLEKIFQLSAPVPGIQPYYRDRFFTGMLQEDASAPNEEEEEEDLDILREEATEALRREHVDSDIMAVLERQTRGSPRDLVYRAEAVKRLVDPRVRDKTEHRLRKYKDLLGDNPRTIRRVVNTHLVQQQLVTLTGAPIGADDLPLWAILVTRWPAFAEYLGQHPNTLDFFRDDPPDFPEDLPEDLRPLFVDDEVKHVIEGVGISGASIKDETTIWHCARLSS